MLINQYTQQHFWTNQFFFSFPRSVNDFANNEFNWFLMHWIIQEKEKRLDFWPGDTLCCFGPFQSWIVFSFWFLIFFNRRNIRNRATCVMWHLYTFSCSILDSSDKKWRAEKKRQKCNNNNVTRYHAHNANKFFFFIDDWQI